MHTVLLDKHNRVIVLHISSYNHFVEIGFHLTDRETEAAKS